MASPNHNRPRLAVALALMVFVALLSLALRVRDGWLGDGLVRSSYDSLHQLRGTHEAALDNCPIAIVYLDLNSFKLKELDPAQPWPRRLHAQLLDQLTVAGARAVVFDIIFSEPGADAAADLELAAAIQRNGRVVLAGESNEDASHVTSQDENWGRLSTLLLPTDLFRTNAVAWGVASHIIDDDYVVRRYLAGFTSQEQPSLTWAAAEWLQLPITKNGNAVRVANEFRIRYYGPALVLPNVGYAEALNSAGVPPDFFRDKIVFVGARPMAEQFGSRQDEFRNPFHSWGHKELFMPGVEVHATELLNLVRGDWLRRLSPGAETAWLLLTAALFGGGLIWLRPVRASVAAFGGAGAVLGLAVAGFAKGIWFPWLIVVGAQIPVALGGAVLFHSIEWYRARRRFEARIREQAALIDKAHDAILVQSMDGKILYANASAEQLYGWKLVELQRDGAAEELFTPDTEVVKRARVVTLDAGEWNGELRQQTKSGRIVIVASRWTLIRDASGKPKELLLINSDVTDQKELEAQFLRTQRMNTIGTLAGGMAHDLNNALAPILMGTQLLRRRATDNETRELLSLMETNTHRGAEMVRQVLLFARGRGGEFERLKLGTVVNELEKLVRETFPKNIAVESFVPTDLWLVRGNPTQLHQVLLNLCVNARDAMPSGGKLSFVTDNVELGESAAAKILDGKAGEFVSLSVRIPARACPRKCLREDF
jgi:PAS domain S-box-containing protein